MKKERKKYDERTKQNTMDYETEEVAIQKPSTAVFQPFLCANSRLASDYTICARLATVARSLMRYLATFSECKQQEIFAYSNLEAFTNCFTMVAHIARFIVMPPKCKLSPHCLFMCYFYSLLANQTRHKSLLTDLNWLCYILAIRLKWQWISNWLGG